MKAADPRQRGFTLIELLVTLTILVIMMGLGVPAMQSFTANQKVRSASYELMTSIVLARSEAIKRNASILLEPKAANDWTSGWTVKAGAATLHEQTPMAGLAITPQSAPGTAMTLANLTFGASGRPTAKAYFEITGTGKTIRCVAVDTTGIPTSKTGTCS
ncbi:GspH/FimT family pseudopilin [Ramlibacter tataouinensis]|uniref:GspH/FimT family pseudopilin n=1 Tax=Ramlibacter tataouinensis TaxID=94132 RepID=UPI0022F3BA59|nr:GspH/FimT family pseudopilin [Ramlibacter tataouinensis]WBY01577.1 GspH/FimT family pseudopilin [Ramlibacter tataouinensis]